MKVRIETGYAVNLIEGSLGSRRQHLQLRFGQEAVAQLYGPQVVKNHVVASRKKRSDPKPMRARAGVWRRNSLHTNRRARLCKAPRVPLAFICAHRDSRSLTSRLFRR